MSTFLGTMMSEYNRMRARHFAAGDGYEGVKVAGVLVVARDSGAMVLAQRAADPDDDPGVVETWEMPGGHLDEGEEPYAAALREFSEEVGTSVPAHEVVHGWRAGDEDQYQGFLVAVEEQFAIDPANADPEEVQNVGWFTPEEAATLNLRPEFAKLDLNQLVEMAVSRNQKESPVADPDLSGVEEMTDAEPLMSMFDLAPGPIPVHGVIAPEDVESGDGRGFNAGAMTSRPLRLPLRHQQSDIGGHDGAVTVGSIDRMMRKDGLIHWEGALMNTAAAEDLFDLLLHFGRYGLSVDGDRGSLDAARSEEEGGTWFDAVRAAAATAVAIPAFHEAYVALGPHPEMPQAVDDEGEALVAAMTIKGDLVGASTYDRGPGWVTNPRETKRIHDYWTKKGEPGYAKIAWGTNGDYTRCTRLVGEKIAKNSPEDMRYIKRICAQWHHDALGYWPGELGKPGNPPDTKENRRRAATHASLNSVFSVVPLAEDDPVRTEGYCAASCGRNVEYRVSSDDEQWAGLYCAECAPEHEDKPIPGWTNPDLTEIEDASGESAWEAVLVSSASAPKPPLEYFHRHPDTGAFVIEDADEHGFRRVYGYAAQWGVCHIGLSGECVEPPRTYSDDYPSFHLGRTKVEGGYISTGVLTYGVGHRDAQTILNESAEQAYFDNTNNAWAAVRVGEDETGIWFSGVVLPHVPAEDLVVIQASGQVSGEWLRGAMRACLTVNVPGYAVERPSVEYDENGNVLALAASAFGQVADAPCEPTPAERMAALRKADAEARFEALRDSWAQTQRGA